MVLQLLLTLFFGWPWQSHGVAPVIKRSALQADQQLGLTMPAADAMDFTVSAATPLAHVAVDPQAEATAKQTYVRGLSTLSVFVHREDGELRLQVADAATSLKHGSWVQVATAKYNNTVEHTGWAYFSVAATEEPHVSRELKMYAAGFLEGFMTAKSIRDFQHNANIGLQASEEKHHALGNIHEMFGSSVSAICNKSGMAPRAALLDRTAPKDTWWRQARYAVLQAWGTLDAYNRQVALVKGKAMSMVDLLVLNSDGETPELEMAYDMEESLLRQSQTEGDNSTFDDDSDSNTTSTLTKDNTTSTHHTFLQRSARYRSNKPGAKQHLSEQHAHLLRDIKGLTSNAWRRIKQSSGRCSALVRLTAGNKDLMVGHTTFSDYSEMTRVFKYYDLPLGPDVVRRMGFSSYPGVAGSTDDYYLLDSGLVITETTLSMLSDEPYDKLDNNNERVPDFMRIMLANRLARTGQDWVELMRKSATGTYSSQWMVVDYNKFKPGVAPNNGTLFVLEQVPGFQHSQDMTPRLNAEGYWASENRPWFKDVRDFMGASEAEEYHGKLYSADENPRARIFHATAPQVQSLAEMRVEMRRNRWPHENVDEADNQPDHAIAARGDLDHDHPNPNGGVDAKVTNFCLAKRLMADAVSGPTSATQKPFRWTDAASGKELYPGTPHDGLPNVWNFDWVRMSPGGEENMAGDCNA